MSIQRRLIWSSVLTLPVAIQMFLMLTTNEMNPLWDWLALACATLVIVVGAGEMYKSAWYAFLNHHANMDTLVALGTLTAYLASIWGMVTHRAVFFDSVAFVVTFVLLGQVLEKRMRKQTEAALAGLADLQAKVAQVRQGDQVVELPIEQVGIGMHVLVAKGEVIPVDGVVMAGVAKVNEAMVTGESELVTKQVHERVIGGTQLVSGDLEIVVDHVGAETVLAKIVALVKQAQTSQSPVQALVDKISAVFVPLVMMVAIATFAIWYLGLNVSGPKALEFAVAVLVIACPCALGLATPAALVVGVGRAAKAGLVVRNAEALMALPKLDAIVFDKTGTLTEGKPVVVETWGDLTSVADFMVSLEAGVEHPLAQAIVDYYPTAVKHEVAGVQVIAGQGVKGNVAGHEVLIGNEQLMAGATWPADLQAFKEVLPMMTHTPVLVAIDYQIVGGLSIADGLRPEVPRVLQQLASVIPERIILTGDKAPVANELVATNQLAISQVLAEVSPQDKAHQIMMLQATGKKVAFVGDGINDAPALTMADVGIVMGSGVNVALQSGDVVLLHNDLRLLPLAVNLGRALATQIKVNLWWAMIYNLLGIPVAAGCLVSFGVTLTPAVAGMAMALSSVSVLLSSLTLKWREFK
ncbi:heavy metal translocating P-type ATPase [Limosilactobacillus equigenerosi]|uniref:P-type Cu(+) transporter n=2 Tax=Limosilactobacillus TaxID=2742598 RepID=A0A0R1UTK8_9LACO|nr:heavy metal translocating P-type ATPase [Limosilactobacillus equigenerosi]KRL96497.1 P-ATPase superfamily P-type ATPase copper transporter [Limosilactobacillus equigenerosi DSM 18793 = JCM 14505]